MPLILKVNGRDLAPYLRVAHDDGLDPSPAESIEPQFAGSAALGEGQTYVGDAVSNPQMSFPLILKAATTDALYQLIRDIRRDLVRGAPIEYRSGGATQSTFFDLEEGKLDPDFEFWLDQAGRCRAQLTLWRRPHGHTGTTRLVASGVNATGPFTLPISGLQGDVPARADFQLFSLAQASQYLGGVIWGVRPNAATDYGPHLNASSFAGSIAGRASTMTAAERISGREVAWGPTSIATQTNMDLLNLQIPAPAFLGRHRLLLSVQSQTSYPTAANAEMIVRTFRDNTMTPDVVTSRTAISIATPFAYKHVDCGEISVPSGPDWFNIKVEVALATFSSLGTALATYPWRIDGMSLIPVDSCAGAVVVPPSERMINVPSGVVRFDGVDGFVGWGIRREFLGSSMVRSEDWRGIYRGDRMEIPPSGTSMLVVWPLLTLGTGLAIGARPNKTWVGVRERFSYLR